MPIKTTVAEWLAFVETPWPEGWMIEEEVIFFGDADEPDEENDFYVDHLRTLDPAMPVRIDSGTITHETDRDFGRDLLSEFRAWRKKREVTTVVVEVPRAREAEFVALLEAQGFKVPRIIRTSNPQGPDLSQPGEEQAAPAMNR